MSGSLITLYHIYFSSLPFLTHPAQRPERSIPIDRPSSHAEGTSSLGDFCMEFALLLLDVLRTGLLLSMLNYTYYSFFYSLIVSLTKMKIEQLTEMFPDENLLLKTAVICVII